MTGARASAVFTPESEFGKTPSDAEWYAFPSGLSFDFTPTNNMSTYYEIGSKFLANAVGGKYNVSWSAKFKLDYRYIEFMGMIFEGYTYTSGIHLFTKANGKRVKSSTIRVKKLNRFVGGSHDQTYLLKGCVVKSFDFSQGSGATLDCTISGTAIIDSCDYSDLDSTDWSGVNSVHSDESVGPVPIEWTCLQVDGEPVAYTESVRFGVDNGVEFSYGCGSRFIQNYNEKNTNITISTSVWSVNPETYQRRMYSGGYLDSLTEPKKKGLKPLSTVALVSDYTSVHNNFEYEFLLSMRDVFVNGNGSTSLNANGKIMDSPNLIPTNFGIVIKSDAPSLASIWGYTNTRDSKDALDLLAEWGYHPKTTRGITVFDDEQVNDE
jgi:hypothetical protein